MVGALLLLIAILLPPESFRIPKAFVAVLVGLLVTGLLGAQLGGSPRRAAVIRLVVGGALAMIVAFGIGQLLGPAWPIQTTPPARSDVDIDCGCLIP